MRLITEIKHYPQENYGKIVRREAVRGILMLENRLWMVFSSRQGDYKFPGGGIQPGEGHPAALEREIHEETGMSGIKIIKPFGQTIEYDLAIEPDYDTFKMVSTYYWCKPGAITTAQQLDPYEAELGFTPVWIELEQAIQANRGILQGPRASVSRWVRRELFVLETLKAETNP